MLELTTKICRMPTDAENEINMQKDGYFFAVKNKRYTLLDANEDMMEAFTLANFNDARNTDGNYMGVR